MISLTALFALWERPIGAWGIVDVLKLIVVIAACIGIVYVALRVFGVTIPPWVVQIFWIVVAAFVAIFAINLIASM